LYFVWYFSYGIDWILCFRQVWTSSFWCYIQCCIHFGPAFLALEWIPRQSATTNTRSNKTYNNSCVCVMGTNTGTMPSIPIPSSLGFQLTWNIFAKNVSFPFCHGNPLPGGNSKEYQSIELHSSVQILMVLNCRAVRTNSICR